MLRYSVGMLSITALIPGKSLIQLASITLVPGIILGHQTRDISRYQCKYSVHTSYEVYIFGCRERHTG